MSILPPNPKAAYTGQAAPFAIRPRLQRGRNEQRRIVKLDVRIGVVKMQIGRDLAVMNRQRRLHQARNTRRRFAVSEVRLHRSDRERRAGNRSFESTARKALASMTSPSNVPAPWVSIYWACSSDNPALAQASPARPLARLVRCGDAVLCPS